MILANSGTVLLTNGTINGGILDSTNGGVLSAYGIPTLNNVTNIGVISNVDYLYIAARLWIMAPLRRRSPEPAVTRSQTCLNNGTVISGNRQHYSQWKKALIRWHSAAH